MRKKVVADRPRVTEKQVNSMYTSILNMANEKENKYNANFLHYCISRLHEKFGQSRRYIMCRLLEKGLSSDEMYSSVLEDMKREYDIFVSGNSVANVK